MARIRSLHPGLASDEDFVALGRDARLFYLLLLTECDDQGVFEWKPRTLKMRLFPADGDVDIDALLFELAAVNKIRCYEIDGRKLGAVRNFRKFQRPKSPKSIFPTTPEVLAYIGLPAPVSSCQTDNEPRFPQNGEISAHERIYVPPNDEPLPQNGEINPQMEEEGCRRKDVEEGGAAVALIRAFDDERVKIFGAEQKRPFPNASDHVMAGRWIEAGASEALCRATFSAILQRVKAQAHAPPASLKYFDQAILQAIADGRAPLPKSAPASPQVRDHVSKTLADVPWAQRIRVFRKGGTWRNEWGFPPGERGCQVPDDLLLDHEIAAKEGRAA